MRIQLIHIIFFITIASVLFSCKKEFEGTLNANQAPNTFTIIDTIIRFGDDRLTSQVTLNWWGNDADGFIVGYEYTFDEIISDATIWSYIEIQDSTFILAPAQGEDTANYVFHIRAIDNDGLSDPTPAQLVIPVKNSPPTIVFTPGINNPKKSFPVLKYYWGAGDPDGENNVEYFQLYFNDTTASPYILDKTVTSVLFHAQDATADNFICNVFSNASSIAEEETINGLSANVWNKLYIRAIDQSGAMSTFAISDSVFVKQVTSSILLVDGYTATSPINFYVDNLSENGFSVLDTIKIFEEIAGAYTQQSADNITQGKVFNLFDIIIWFSNDANNSFSLAQKTTNDFFIDNGKMLMSVYISSSFDPLSNFLDFTPIASLIDPSDTTLILDLGAQLNPTDVDYPVLQGTSIVGIVKPIALQPGATELYNADLTAKNNITLEFSPWTGNSTVIAKKINTGGETNFVISTLEIQKLDGLLNMNDFFQKILIDEFGL
ncbi:MAG: hypothetical protein H7Y00_02735 [Fimbriimonadaceae bacterium]|nr:hypothetical protein [Chitinophagales bacterium]